MQSKTVLCVLALTVFLVTEAAIIDKPKNLNATKYLANINGVTEFYGLYQRDVKRILKHLTGDGPMSGVTYDWLANLTDTFGNRYYASPRLEAAIKYLVDSLQTQGFDNVHAEPVPDMPKWVRGIEQALLIEPRPYNMSLLGTGYSVGGDVTAEAVVVQSFDELNALGADKVKGKIVVYNQPWVSYGKSVAYRSGAIQAAALGAVAVLIRSVTPFSIYSPHTGMGDYKDSIPKIPSACITVEDAMMLWRMQQRGQKIKIRVRLDDKTDGTVTSHNTVFELRGTERPNEIVLLSGHLDSWDVGQGAMDDGGGVATMWAAVTTLKQLGLRPKRTIRVVFWTAEEMGMLGSSYYYHYHKNNTKNETYVFVSESDEGAFKPDSWNANMYFAGTRKQQRRFELMTALLNLNGVKLNVKSGSPYGLGDVAPWAVYDKVPGTFYLNQDKYECYFRFHHTNADMMTIFNRHDFDTLAASYAALSWMIANDNKVF